MRGRPAQPLATTGELWKALDFSFQCHVFLSLILKFDLLLTVHL